jgi:predicted phosphodiesterase
LEKLLQTDTEQYRKVIGMTHMPPFTEAPEYEVFCANLNYFQPLKDKCDVLLVGHSHKYVNRVEDGCHIMNAGNHYDKPRFLMFEV